MSALDSFKGTPLQSPLVLESTQHSSSDASFIFIRDVTSAEDSNPDVSNSQIKDDTINDGIGHSNIDVDTTIEFHREGTFDISENGDERDELMNIDDKSTVITNFTEEGITLTERTNTNLVSEKTDYLMSEQEIADWDKRIEETVDRLQKQQEDYEHWENKLNRRRLDAYERLKKLKSYHSQRVGIYNAIQTYLVEVNTLLDNKAN